MMMKDAKLGWAGLGAGPEQGRSRAGAGQEQSRSRAELGKKRAGAGQDSSHRYISLLPGMEQYIWLFVNSLFYRITGKLCLQL